MTSIHDAVTGSPGSGRQDELEAALAAARLGYCKLHAETRSLRANSQFKAEFGWAPDESPTWEALEERVVVQDRDALGQAIRAALRTGREVDLRIRVVWPQGALQWLALRGRVLDEMSGERSLILTSRNVSGEKEAAEDRASTSDAILEHERRLRSQAEAANRGKDQFLSVFSHELRSPLNAILGWNRILALKRPDDSEVVSITQRIEHSARSQLKMVNDLLDLGRIETGKLHVEKRPMQLAPVVATALDVARPSAAAKDIVLQAQFEQGAGQVLGDPDRLQQLVTNLLSNAVKFTPSGGRITVALRNLHGFSELRVQDTGQGIPPELLPHVFDRFWQADRSSTRQAGGLGLGLALVREIVTLHGGTVAAQSPGPGLGATFIARLPARQASRPSEPHLSPGPEPCGARSLCGLSVLVVDDESDARNVVAETLRLEGASVTVTDSASAAFAKLQEAGARFDVVVTDIGMPEEDGYTLVRRLRTLQGGRQMVAIAVTGYASSHDVAAAMAAGFDLHVPKPVDFNTFVPMVRRLAHQART